MPSIDLFNTSLIYLPLSLKYDDVNGSKAAVKIITSRVPISDDQNECLADSGKFGNIPLTMSLAYIESVPFHIYIYIYIYTLL